MDRWTDGQTDRERPPRSPRITVEIKLCSLSMMNIPVHDQNSGQTEVSYSWNANKNKRILPINDLLPMACQQKVIIFPWHILAYLAPSSNSWSECVHEEHWWKYNDKNVFLKSTGENIMIRTQYWRELVKMQWSKCVPKEHWWKHNAFWMSFLEYIDEMQKFCNDFVIQKRTSRYVY